MRNVMMKAQELAESILDSEIYQKMKQQENAEKAGAIRGEVADIAWGSQIRSYVFCPYTLVKDHRTGYEEVNVDAVMNGNLDGFINAFLSGMTIEK